MFFFFESVKENLFFAFKCIPSVIASPLFSFPFYPEVVLLSRSSSRTPKLANILFPFLRMAFFFFRGRHSFSFGVRYLIKISLEIREDSFLQLRFNSSLFLLFPRHFPLRTITVVLDNPLLSSPGVKLGKAPCLTRLFFPSLRSPSPPPYARGAGTAHPTQSLPLASSLCAEGPTFFPFLLSLSLFFLVLEVRGHHHFPFQIALL